MRGFGIFLLIAGVIAVVAAMGMDTSVSTGLGGRVNNIGLMADRQNYTMIGGLIAIAGLIMVIFGGRKTVETVSAGVDYDSRPCPLCAETIKRAAIKCKHCGADVEPAGKPIEPGLRFGWVARVICQDEETRSRVSTAISQAGFPVVEMLKVGGVAAGAYEKKADAEAAASHLEDSLGFSTTVMFRDKVSGDYS